MRSGRGAGAAWALLLALAAVPAAAQQSPQPTPFLFINQEQLLTGSNSGKALLAGEDQERDALRVEARSIDSAFEEEEKRLTEQRAKLKPEEFRKIADDFDARVVAARRDQDNKASALAQEFDQKRRQFYAQVAPILVMLMDRYRARAIFDENSVLLADQTLNITGAVIAEIDARAGAVPPAAAPQPAPPAAAPAPAAPAEPPDVGSPTGSQGGD